jgi:hypothetical protein
VKLIYTSDLLTSDNTTTATFADDTAFSATHEDAVIASKKLQATINKINDWEKKWRIKISQSKAMHITFTLRNQSCQAVQMGNVDLPQKNEVKYYISASCCIEVSLAVFFHLQCNNNNIDLDDTIPHLIN